jgi:hypothetical protein
MSNDVDDGLLEGYSIGIDPGLHVPTDDTAVSGTPVTDLTECYPTVIVDEAVAAELERIEYAVRGAIIAGYDGVDVHRSWNHYLSGEEIEAIVPWRGEPPEPGGDYRTDRYAWPWFDNDELAEIARTGEVPQIVREVNDG